MHNFPGHAPQPCCSKATTASTWRCKLTLNSSLKWRLLNRNTETQNFYSPRQKIWKYRRKGFLKETALSTNTALQQYNPQEKDTAWKQQGSPSPGQEAGSQEECLWKYQETGLQGAGKTSTSHRPLAPDEPLTLGKTLHSTVPNLGSGYSSSLPELNKQPSFKRLTYMLFFLEKKTHNKSRGFT